MTSRTVLHISGDYPDAVQPRKTRAIAALVEGTAGHFDHRVYSINRVPLGWRLPGCGMSVADDDHIASWTYAAPPLGMLLTAAMRQLAARIVTDVHKRGLKPVLVHAHKLSIEGLAGEAVARSFGIPYALSLQGNTDQKVLSVRRDLRARYAALYHGARAIFPFAPWIERWCDARLGAPACTPVALPCITAADAILPPRQTAARVISAFHLEHYRLKNAGVLIGAMADVAGQHDEATLEIGGNGPVGARAAIDTMIARTGYDRRICRIGAVPSANIQQWMNGAAVFAMPSRRETFGMVFAEALMAGCPIVYPAGRAVDGYFDGCSFALAVAPDDRAGWSRAIAELITDQPRRKADLAAWQATDAAQRFRKDAILAAYREGLDRALASSVIES
jgi:glycosyltransferase involved in cell wall biosynthesis